MAGSRRDKLGSIFSRLTGLLRSGAMKEEDRPIWYDVVKAFPPQPKPAPKQNIPNILYPEDFVRVQFYNTFTDPGATRLADGKTKSVQQRFVDQYLELNEKKTVSNIELFDETVRIMKEQGVKLITHKEKRAADKSQLKDRKTQGAARDRDGQYPQLQENDPYIANSSIISSRSGKPQEKEQGGSSGVNLDSLFEDPR